MPCYEDPTQGTSIQCSTCDPSPTPWEAYQRDKEPPDEPSPAAG